MNFFYIETPIQAICAHEVICGSQGRYYLIARFNRHRASDIQLENTLKHLGLEYDTLILRPGIDIWSLPGVLAKILKFALLRRKSVLYIGDYFSKFGSLLRRTVFRSSQFIYLDDGLSTLKAVDRLNEAGVNAEFFTLFHREIDGSVTSRPNKLERLSGRVISGVEPRGIIIGTHYVESGFATLKDYLALLKGIVSAYDCEFVYYAHREEKDENTSVYGQELGVDVRRPDTPIEITLLESGIDPKIFVSVLSSASFTLRYLFPYSDSYVVQLPLAARGAEENYKGIIDYAELVFGASHVLSIE